MCSEDQPPFHSCRACKHARHHLRTSPHICPYLAVIFPGWYCWSCWDCHSYVTEEGPYPQLYILYIVCPAEAPSPPCSITLKKNLLDSAAVLHIKTEPANQQVTDVLIIPPQAELLHTPVPLQLNEIIRGGHTSHTHRFDKNTEAICFRHASDTYWE